MDLTKTYPRSVHEKLHGVVQLPRTIDKGKALARGNIGEYHYNCSMDQAVFGFLGIDHEELLNVIKNANSDAGIEAYVKAFVDKKSPAEIESWNTQWVTRTPEGESLTFFLQLREQIAPDRTDVTSWADLLDLDEKRQVPKRQPAVA
ncbi:MAG TPA: DUF5069 domain-containing protein [Candidatus Baltobacteraceae bacterium]|jgi:hypothetical protein|nr:DUF5069 domain-containing protein [Candidatus Baltobacteraceae bacterium]